MSTSTHTQVQQQIKRSQTFSAHNNVPYTNNQNSNTTKSHNKSQSAAPQSLSQGTEHFAKDNPLFPLHPTYQNTVLITQWLGALDRFDNGKLNEALQILIAIEPKNSKINYNIASIHATMDNYNNAIFYFKSAIENDNYMAISYFQIGVCRFLSGHYRNAADSFNTALKLLRGNSVINYQQLGLEYKLYSCEIMYNRALSYIYSGQMTVGIYDLGFAAKEKQFIPEHSILNEALAHFSESKEYLQPDPDKQNTLKHPKTFDSRSQRFSLLAPPSKVPGLTPASSTNSTASSTSIDSISTKNDTESQSSLNATSVHMPEKKEMVYSLFSVPQGALFRLTETKVQCILGEKYMGAMMLGMPNNTPISAKPTNIAQNSRETSGSPVPPYSQTQVPPRMSSKTSSHTLNGVSPVGGQPSHVKQSSSVSLSSSTPNQTESYKQPTTKNIPLPSIPSDNAASSLYSGSSSTSVNTSNTSGNNLNVIPLSSNNIAPPPLLRNRSKFQHLQPVVEHNPVGNKPPDDKQNQSKLISNTQAPLMQAYPGPKANTRYEGATEKYSNHDHNPGQRLGSPIKEPPPRSAERNKSIPEKISSAPEVMASSKQPYAGVVTLPHSPISPESDSQHSSPETKHMLRNLQPPHAMSKIKIKIHCDNETRVMLVPQDISYTEFRSRLASKLDGMSDFKTEPDTIYIRIKDEDGDFVLLGDQEDLSVALEELATDGVVPTMRKLAVYVEILK